ncbi:MAG: hypothetical protein AAF085_02445 [Planctomycetota bacterium]
MIHVAILKPGYIKAILDGRKTIESRMTKTKQPPYGQVESGERIYLKASGGPFMATAIAGEVNSFSALAPDSIQQIRDKHGEQIGGDDAYWDMKRDSKYATLIELTKVEPIQIGPPYKVAYMKAWYVLDEDRDPMFVARRLMGEG